MAEGADVPLSRTVPDSSSRCPPDVCVAVTLGDALHRVSVLGGREGMPRSLGSVYGGSITRFLGGGLRGRLRRKITRCQLTSIGDGGCEPLFDSVAFSSDGATLLVPDSFGVTSAIHVLDARSFTLLRVVGGRGSGPLRFRDPLQLCVADDGFVFIADSRNRRVQVLTPGLDFHGFVGAGQLRCPAAVCANDSAVAVADTDDHVVTVFRRSDGKLLTRFGRDDGHDGELRMPVGLCFASGGRHIAVANSSNSRVSVFSVGGDFIRNVGARVLTCPEAVACSAFDELVVADRVKRRIFVFSDAGDVLMKSGEGSFRGVTVSPAGSRLCSIDMSHGHCECVMFS